MKFGDAFAVVAHPFAAGLDAVLGTDIQHCVSCGPGGYRREFLNRIGDVVVDWFSIPKKGDRMKFKVTRTETVVYLVDDPKVTTLNEAVEVIRKGGGQNVGYQDNVVAAPIMEQQPPSAPAPGSTAQPSSK